MWFNLAAAAQGETTAAQMRDILGKKMTPAQIAEAQKLSREWKPTSSRRLATLADSAELGYACAHVWTPPEPRGSLYTLGFAQP